MNRPNRPWLVALPFLFGGGLFLVGAGRFLARGDGVGAAISGLVGFFVIVVTFVKQTRSEPNAN